MRATLRTFSLALDNAVLDPLMVVMNIVIVVWVVPELWWVLVLLVSRVNIASGETTISDLAKSPLGSFTLSDPLDAVCATGANRAA